ncbi:hypothetical protein GQ600_6017 [Phytophthora cactorum]|nr:hypothetical protein GQ600_6017 [Phytophthora cactorum]
MSRQQVDTVLQSFREQRQLFVGGFIAVIITSFLLCFASRSSRFFPDCWVVLWGLYDPVLEFFTDYHRPVYNVIAFDASNYYVTSLRLFRSWALLFPEQHPSNPLYISDLWWSDFGGECLVWPIKFVTAMKLRLGLRTLRKMHDNQADHHLPTVILTLYLPLTQLAFNVLV